MDNAKVAHATSEYWVVKLLERICQWRGMLDTTHRGICSAPRAGSDSADFPYPLLLTGFSHDLAEVPWWTRGEFSFHDHTFFGHDAVTARKKTPHYYKQPQGMVFCFLGAGLRQPGPFTEPSECHQTVTSFGCSQIWARL